MRVVIQYYVPLSVSSLVNSNATKGQMVEERETRGNTKVKIF